MDYRGSGRGINPVHFIGSVGVVDIASALLRFIIPVAAIIAVAYIFRLFGYGWRIYKPSLRRPASADGSGEIEAGISMIKSGYYLPLVDSIGRELSGTPSAEDFSRLRKELVELSRDGSYRFDRSAMVSVDRVISEMIQLVKREREYHVSRTTGQRR